MKGCGCIQVTVFVFVCERDKILSSYSNFNSVLNIVKNIADSIFVLPSSVNVLRKYSDNLALTWQLDAWIQCSHCKVQDMSIHPGNNVVGSWSSFVRHKSDWNMKLTASFHFLKYT
jgi:hypothetical protein